jgi:hypothetical protein
MKLHNFGAAVMAMAVGIVSAAMSAPSAQNYTPGQTGLLGKRFKHHRGKGKNNRRGTGVQAKPRQRPNMNHVSRRVKRKHRRAA